MIAMAGSRLAWSGVTNIFAYNQSLWQFDKGQRQGRLHQAQNMSLNQVGLWREDLRDVFEYWTKKIDQITLVATLMVGFTVGHAQDDPMDPNAPAWLYHVWLLNIIASLAYAFIALIFSLYASILWQVMKAKTMTEIVRLPIPDTEAIQNVSAIGRAYEDPRNVRTMLRVPVIGHKAGDQKDVAPTTEHANHANLTLAAGASPHLIMFREIQYTWQPMADLARTSIICSLTGLTQSFIYLVIGRHMAVRRHVFGVVAGVLILTTANVALQNLHIMVTRSEWYMSFMSHAVPSLWCTAMVTLQMVVDEDIGDVGSPILFLLHLYWTAFLLCTAMPGQKDRSVWRIKLLQHMMFPPYDYKKRIFNKMFQKEFSFVQNFGDEHWIRATFRRRRQGVIEEPKLRDDLETFNASVFGDALASEKTVLPTGAPIWAPSMRSMAEDEATQIRGAYNRCFHAAAALLGRLEQTGKGNYTKYKEELNSLSRVVDATDPHSGSPEASPSPSDEEGAPLTSARSNSPNGRRSSGRGKTPVCAEGHRLQQVPGGDGGRMCGVCKLPLQAMDSRFSCMTCKASGSTYDACPSCVAKKFNSSRLPGQRRANSSDEEAPSDDSMGSGMHERVSPKKTERLLKAAIVDLRDAVARFDEREDEMGGTHNQPIRSVKSVASHKSTVSQRERQLHAERSAALNDSPLKREAFEEALEAEGCSDLDTMPWHIWSSVTSLIFFCYFFMFGLSIANLVTDQEIGRIQYNGTTGQAEYLDLSDDGLDGFRSARDRYYTHDHLYDTGGIPRPASRRLASRGSVWTRMVSAIAGDQPTQAVAHFWSGSSEVAAWLLAQGHAEPAREVFNRGVDGTALRYLDENGWREIGVSAAVDHTKLVALLSRIDDEESPGVEAVR